MTLDLFTSSKEKEYDAKALYSDGAIVYKGSKINTNPSAGFTLSALVKKLLSDRTIVGSDGVLLKDVEFKSLSTAATFVIGRIASGMMAWKTIDGKYVRCILKEAQ